MRPFLALVLSALVASAALAGCGTGSDDTPSAAGPSTTTVETTTSVTPPENDGDTATSTTAATDTTTEPEEDIEEEQADDIIVIAGSLADGEIQVDDRRFDIPLGASVRLEFTSDEVEHIHLHGYDLLVDLTPGEPAELTFVADSPGTFEVELEDSGRFLYELLVR